MSMSNVAPFLASSILAVTLLAPADTPEYTQAKTLARDVLKSTRALLDSELAEKGPPGALWSCSKIALEEARKHEGEGWRVRRVSFKARNPADRPDPFEKKVLRRFEKLHRRDSIRPETEFAAIVTEDGARKLRYMRPIMIPDATCLTCHGSKADLDVEIRGALEVIYPNDPATGYKVGDLRGAMSVSIPMEAREDAKR